VPLELLLLALASAVWPILLAVVLVALQSEQPQRLLACFLAGGLLTCVVVGMAIVTLLEDTDAVSGSRPPANPIFYFGGGVAALVAATMVARRPPRVQHESNDQPSLATRLLRRGALLAFVAGVVLNIAPGVFPFVALKDIAQLGHPAAVDLAIVVAFYLVMFAFIEVPLIGYAFAPDATARLTGEFNDWLKAHSRKLAVVVLYAAGVLLIARGIAALSLS
jgi:hypothetical protein